MHRVGRPETNGCGDMATSRRVISCKIFYMGSEHYTCTGKDWPPVDPTWATTPARKSRRCGDWTPRVKKQRRADQADVGAARDSEAEADAGAEGVNVGAAAEAPAAVTGDDMDVTEAEGGEGSEAAPMSKKKKKKKRAKRPSGRTREARKAERDAIAE